jgi:hypothetical protein
MAFVFKPADIRALSKALGVPAVRQGAAYRFDIPGKDPARRLSVELYSGIAIGAQRGTLITVYTGNAHLQLHFCSGYVVSSLLGEVTFIGEQQGRLSGLIVEREGGCSLYANVDRSLLSGDFTKLGPEVMLSGIALSLTDGMLDMPGPAPRRTRTTRTVRRRTATRRR